MSVDNIQPFLCHTPRFDQPNKNLTNAKSLKRELENIKGSFSPTSDLEPRPNLIRWSYNFFQVSAKKP